ncbi:MAG: MBL fold metallo-hydrolase [Muribaculaceae bacterium]|nr:MBL fold metallo-hydrolase [Muribaculaceae bacterium]
MSKNITQHITYIGVDDHDLDLFEGQYALPNGISYNSFIIFDEKTAIIDTVDFRKSEEWWHNLDKALNGHKPHYLIVHHMEPDHSGNIAKVINRFPEIKIVASAKGIAMLPQFFEGIDFADNTITINDNDTLNLGRHTLRFMTAPMVHWPEVIVTYETSEKILFSADAFGKFGVLSHNENWDDEARRYYFNICGKYGIQVQALLKKATAFDIATICPLHGPILSNDIDHYFGLYDTWSKYEPETDGVFIAYASIYGATAHAAQILAQMLHDRGVDNISICDLCRDDMSKALSEAFRMSRMVIASASYDGGLFPAMHDFLHHLLIKNYQNRRVGIIENGSWAPSAARIMTDMVGRMKNIKLSEPIATIISRMKQTDLTTLSHLATAMTQ